MLKRWAMLALLLLVLPLCVAGWWYSTGREAGLERYASADSSYIRFGTQNGMLFTNWGTYAEPQDADRWYLYMYPRGKPSFAMRADQFSCLGFAFEHSNDPLSHSRYINVAIPYWFVMLLAALGMLIVWKKTRPSPCPKTAFPVESRPHAVSPSAES